MRDTINWARLLAFVTGLVNQHVLLQNEYLAAENRILRAHLPPRLRLSDPERCTLAEIGKRLGRKGLKPVACTAKPDTILWWYRRLIARKFDGSRYRAFSGRPRVGPEVEALVVRFARENSGWGYDRIVGALAIPVHVQAVPVYTREPVDYSFRCRVVIRKRYVELRAVFCNSANLATGNSVALLTELLVDLRHHGIELCLWQVEGVFRAHRLCLRTRRRARNTIAH